MQQEMKKWIYISLGCLCIMLGIIGIFVPLMPTTCFLIAAAWLFTWADHRYLLRLCEHPKLGPLVSKISPRFLPRISD